MELVHEHPIGTELALIDTHLTTLSAGWSDHIVNDLEERLISRMNQEGSVKTIVRIIDKLATGVVGKKMIDMDDVLREIADYNWVWLEQAAKEVFELSVDEQARVQHFISLGESPEEAFSDIIDEISDSFYEMFYLSSAFLEELDIYEILTNLHVGFNLGYNDVFFEYFPNVAELGYVVIANDAQNLMVPELFDSVNLVNRSSARYTIVREEHVIKDAKFLLKGAM